MKKISENLESTLLKAKFHFKSKEYEKALGLAEKSIDLTVSANECQNTVTALLLKMESSLHLGKIVEAKEASALILFYFYLGESNIISLNAALQVVSLQLQLLEYSAASELLSSVIPRIRDKKSALLEAKAFALLSYLNYRQGKYSIALAFAREALKIPKAERNSEFNISMKNHIGKIYAAAKDYHAALEVLDASEKQARKSQNTTSLNECLVHKMDIFRAMGDINQANRICEEVLQLPDDNTMYPEFIRVMGSLAIQIEQYPEALNWFKTVEKKVLERKAEYMLPTVYLGFASAYFGMQSYEMSLSYHYKILDLISPHYFESVECLRATLEQMENIFRKLDRPESRNKISSLKLDVEKLQNLGLDASENEVHLAESVKRDLDNILAAIRLGSQNTFSRGGLRIDLASRAIYRDGKRAKRGLTELQLRIFNLLLSNMGHPLPNAAIIGCYEKDAKGMESDSMPRRAHYFIRELRRKLGKNVIQTVKGEGYMIPSE